MTIMGRFLAFLLLVTATWTACDSRGREGLLEAAALASLHGAGRSQPIPVAGSTILFAASVVIHSEEPTDNGLIQRSSAAGLLTGDLSGTLLFHPTSVFDFANGTLVNTGTQFFAGTIAGSDAVVLHDDRFRFDVDLNTGATTGSVHFSRSNDAPHKGSWFQCDLVIVGTGVTADGDITSDYTGECIRRGNAR